MHSLLQKRRSRAVELRTEIMKLRDKGLKQSAIAVMLGASQPYVSLVLNRKRLT